MHLKVIITAAVKDRAVNNKHHPLTTDQLPTVVMVMTDYHEIPELLEQYMQANEGVAGIWITVPEFRTYFGMDNQSSPAISGFLHRHYHPQFFGCPYRVTKIENLIVTTPQTRVIKRYFIKRRSHTSENINSRDKRMIDHRR